MALLFYRIDREAHERNVATLREAAAVAETAHIEAGTGPAAEQTG